MIKEKVIDCDTKAGFFKVAAKFRSEMCLEFQNLHGNIWCKAHYERMENLYHNLGKKGNLTRFKNLVFLSPYRDEFRALANSKLKDIDHWK